MHVKLLPPLPLPHSKHHSATAASQPANARRQTKPNSSQCSVLTLPDEVLPVSLHCCKVLLGLLGTGGTQTCVRGGCAVFF